MTTNPASQLLETGITLAILPGITAAIDSAKGGEGPEFVRWERWALEEADAIDPLVAGQFDLSAPDSGGASLLASPYAMTSLHSYE